ncbi:MAG: universal stress protein [Bacteroidales bacterium]|nr:universal stress protein [Bacteroidales bacterium]
MGKQKTDILIPVDFKIYCLKSIDYAKKLQAVLKGKIHLLHVVESQSWWDGFFNMDDLIRGANEKLTLLKKEQELPEDTELKVITGKRAVEISKYAMAISARYIIMSDNYPLTKNTKVLGSTISGVIMRAEQPVISITEKEDSIFKNLAVPLDLNQSCRLQLYNSVAIALTFHAKIHLISVLFSEEKAKSSRIHEKIEKYKKTYDDNGIPYTIQLLVKEEPLAYKEIIKYCNPDNVDSVLIMTHKESSKFDNYLGAFAQHIINEVTMPVVSINNASAHFWEKELGKPTDPLGFLK